MIIVLLFTGEALMKAKNYRKDPFGLLYYLEDEEYRLLCTCRPFRGRSILRTSYKSTFLTKKVSNMDWPSTWKSSPLEMGFPTHTLAGLS
jgi:hypothetical protein